MGLIQITADCEPLDIPEFQRVVEGNVPQSAWRARMPDRDWYWLLASFDDDNAAWLVHQSHDGATTLLVGNEAARRFTPHAADAVGNAPDEFIAAADGALGCLDSVTLPSELWP
ncbi:hypothetical protein ACFQ0K_07270 [Nocardioides caeni]|uniref:Uncharacterized protein n=1 Tax=Nocardioides caeni TaxID=574700 RepID=A0A4S8N0Y8_9ACTN|nr:hypothetical protein [Nocardioides caeni]THV09121.1 hypothetical protein E9934_17625 [Nocardioides caeni]